VINLAVMDFIIFLCYEINVNNTRKLIVIIMAYPMLIKDGRNVEKKEKKSKLLSASFISKVL
jgi:hypothetical protein